MSTNTKHTPGPWSIGQSKYGTFIYEGDSENCIAEVYDELPDDLNANARLIAAAPDLLDICESILGEVEYEGLNLESGRAAKLRAAIAKATGQTA